MKLLKSLVLFSVLFLALGASAQKVGVVLSGGGASGLTHIGFLRSLEQQNIPIDYITGTSMGAVIGGLYAAGYTIDEIDAMFASEEFRLLVAGAIPPEQQYYYRERDPDASIARIKISKKGLVKSIPTNLVSPALLDFKLFELLTQASAAAQYNFDSLYIPFRCVAADIEAKQSVVFRDGHLNLAARASATYPFFVEPMQVEGKLLFDGGLYNNFPGNVMYEDFMPDVIIGCNVSEAYDAPQIDDIVSQVRTMIVARGDYDSLCTEMIVVHPDISIGSFDFDQRVEAISKGFVATEARMLEIKRMVKREETPEEKEEKRSTFKKRWKPLEFELLNSEGLGDGGNNYLRNFFPDKKDSHSLEELRSSFFHLYADPNIRSLFPLAAYNRQTGKFDVLLNIRRERDIALRFGGNFSSRSINTGYIGATYHLLGRNATEINADAYFGNFYGEASLGIKQFYNTRIPFGAELRGGIKRWDYFTNFATFFQEVKPSFIVQYESNVGLGFSTPLANKSRLRLDVDGFLLEDEYYLNEDFTNLDTSDNTTLYGATAALEFQRSTLNRKIYSDSGTDLQIGIRVIKGREETAPGSTQLVRDTIMADREWLKAKVSYINYFKKWKRVHLGTRLEAVFSTQPLFSNFRATLLRSPSFEPIPEAGTFFIDQYRNTAYTAGGLIAVIEPRPNFQIRPEIHLYAAPLGELGFNELAQPVRTLRIDPSVISSLSLIYQSPLGPVSISANYYEEKNDPWSFLFNFGYLIPHKRVLD